MSQLWSRILEWIGRWRLRATPGRIHVQVGDPNALDSSEGMDWVDYRTAERLYAAWGPRELTPWVPYHCVPLFAAVERVSNPGPPLPEVAAEQEAGIAELCASPAWPPAWIEPGTWVVCDLPGPRSVAFSARLVAAGMQPVCTFDHWPDHRGLVDGGAVLAQLLRHAVAVEDAVGRLPRTAPPLWICDSGRLGLRPGRPHEFDNRYFLDDSILPGPDVLRAAGIRRMVLVTELPNTRPTEDLNIFADELLKAGFRLERAALADPTLEAHPFVPALPLRRKFSDNVQRNAAGGFGRLVPEPSSGGG